MDSWDRMESWELVLPPSRPSQEHLAWFGRHIGNLSARDPIAVLGSTPELRDLLSMGGFRDVYVLERNLSFLEKMNRLRVTPDTDKVLHGDWMCVLRRCAGRFAAVLSDLTSGNVARAKQEEFYSLIAESLRPGGVFCDKLLSHPIPHERLDELLAKYETAPLNLDTLNRFNCEVFFCSELLTTFGRVDTDLFYAHLNDMRPGPTVRAILRQLPRVTPPGMIWHYGESWDAVRELFDPRFRCTDERLEEWPSPYAARLRLLRWEVS